MIVRRENTYLDVGEDDIAVRVAGLHRLGLAQRRVTRTSRDTGLGRVRAAGEVRVQPVHPTETGVSDVFS